MSTDRSHDLEYLPGLHYALAVVLALSTAFLVIPVGLGWRALAFPEEHGWIALHREAQPSWPAPAAPGAAPAEEGPPVSALPSVGGWIFLLGGALALLYGAALSVGLAVAGRALRARRSHSFCIGVAAAVTFFFPLGTLLGFHTINVLTAPHVRRAFGVVTEAERAG